MTTGREIATKALQKSRVITKNETPSDDEINDTLDAINNMIASWSNDSLLLFARVREEFALSGGQEEYQIGAGATDFNTERPIQILQAFVSQGNVKLQNLSIVNDVLYQRYVENFQFNGIPIYLNYDNNFPIGIIRLYPQPGAAYILTMLSEKQLTSLSLDVDIQYPPGWERAIIFNGAAEIAGEFGTALTEQDAQIAEESLSSIKTAVAKNTTMDALPMGTPNQFNVFRGW